MNLKLAVILCASLVLTVSSCKKDDDDATPTPTPTPTDTVPEFETLSGVLESKTLNAATKYTLDGFVIVPDGVTLTIPAGTLIEGNAGQAENASALIIKQGGKIMAEGTASEPIIFTALGDGKAGALDKMEQGLWGGLIILGKATTNNSTQREIEGVPTDIAAVYGYDANSGASDADNSGVLKYVSVRHGGTDIGAGNEINGISFGAVGSGTTVDYVEVVSNADDGFEFFGGSVSAKHLLSAYCGDDSYDYDEGYHGKGQFWVSVQTTGTGDNNAEQDGGVDSDEQATPYAMPTFYNFTYVGNKGKLMIFRDNAGGTYANSIFVNCGEGIRVEYRNDKHNSYNMFDEGNLKIMSCVFDSVAKHDTAKVFFVKAEKKDDGTELGPVPSDAKSKLKAHFTANGNKIAITGVSASNLSPTTAVSVSAPSDSWFDAVTYAGAFDATDWTVGWTLFSMSK